MTLSPRWRSSLRAAAPLAAQLLFLAALYWPIRRLSLVSDGWAILGEVPEGVGRAFLTTIGYHYIPIAGLLVQAGRELFGVRSAAWQVANLLQFALVAHLAFRVGRRLMPAWLAFLGSLLFMANSSFHEVTHWSVVGNIHSLAATFHLLGMRLVLDLRDGAPPLARGTLLALCAALGALTYEGAASIVPVAGAVLLLGLEFPEGSSLRERAARVWRRVILPLLLCAAVLLAIVVARTGFTARTSEATQFGVDSDRIVLLARGAAGLFSLQAADATLQRIVRLGWPHPEATVAFAKGWMVVGAAVLLVVVARFRRSGPAVLLAWLGVHMALTVVSIGMVSRHNYIPAIPAALLTAWTLGAIAERACRGVAEKRRLQARVALTAMATLALVLLALPDLQRARRVWSKASRANRELARTVSALAGSRVAPVVVCYVNMPATLLERDIGAYVFQNGLTEIGRIYGGGRVGGIDIAHTYAPTPANPMANASRPVSQQEVLQWAKAPDRLVITFDVRPWQVRVISPPAPVAGVWSPSPEPR